MTATTSPATRMGSILRAAREAHGWALDEAVFQVRLRYRHLRITRNKINRLELGQVARERLDLGFVAALCDVYGIALADLDPDGELGLADEISEMVAAGTAVSRWTPEDPSPAPFRPRLAA